MRAASVPNFWPLAIGFGAPSRILATEPGIHIAMARQILRLAGMLRRLRLGLIIPLVIAGLLAPKLSALILHIHPGVTSVVICNGAELIRLTLGPDGTPIGDLSYEHAPCLFEDPDTDVPRILADARDVPRSYRYGFEEITHPLADADGLAQRPDPRGPPQGI